MVYPFPNSHFRLDKRANSAETGSPIYGSTLYEKLLADIPKQPQAIDNQTLKIAKQHNNPSLKNNSPSQVENGHTFGLFVNIWSADT